MDVMKSYLPYRREKFITIRNSKDIIIKDFIAIPSKKALGFFVSKTKNGWIKIQTYGEQCFGLKKVVEKV